MLRRIENKIPPRTTVIMSSWKASFLLWNISFFRIAASYSYRELCDCPQDQQKWQTKQSEGSRFAVAAFCRRGLQLCKGWQRYHPSRHKSTPRQVYTHRLLHP